MTKIKMHISKVKLLFYPSCEVKCGLQNRVSTMGRTLEWVWVEAGGRLSKTILLMVGRPLSKGTTSEKASEESPPFLVDLGLAEIFLLGMGVFITFTFFSQPGGIITGMP